MAAREENVFDGDIVVWIFFLFVLLGLWSGKMVGFGSVIGGFFFLS